MISGIPMVSMISAAALCYQTVSIALLSSCDHSLNRQSLTLRYIIDWLLCPGWQRCRSWQSRPARRNCVLEQHFCIAVKSGWWRGHALLWWTPLRPPPPSLHSSLPATILNSYDCGVNLHSRCSYKSLRLQMQSKCSIKMINCRHNGRRWRQKRPETAGTASARSARSTGVRASARGAGGRGSIPDSVTPNT